MDIALGDPGDETNPFGFSAMVTRDTAEAFPVKLASKVAPELALCFVPAEYGGGLSTVDDALMKVRVAARRDVTVMPATMFSITAATCVLLAGSPEQRAYVVKLLADASAADQRALAERVQVKLFDRGILAVGLTFPVVPKGDETIRFQINAAHTEADIADVLAAL